MADCAVRSVVAAVLAGMAVSASAQTTLEVGVGAGTSDNINRAAAPGGQIDETIRFMDLGVGVDKETARSRTTFQGDFRYLDYTDDTFGSELVGGARLESNLRFLPERFHWQVTDNFGTQNIDPLQSITPGNRQDVNVFRTGPDVMFGLNDRNRIELQVRGVWASYEDTPADNERLDRNLSWTRDISSRLAMSLGVGRQTTKFDDIAAPANDEFDFDSATITTSITGVRSNLDITVGMNEVQSDSVSEDGTLINVNFGRQIGNSGRLNFRADKSYSAAGDIFRLNQSVGLNLGRTQDLIAVADPFESTSMALGFSATGSLTNWDVRVFRNKDDYLTMSQFDRRYIGLDLGLQRALFSRWTIAFEGTLIDEDSQQQDDEETALRVELARRIGRTLRLRLTTERVERDLTGGLSDEEQRYLVSFSYSRAPSGQGQASVIDTFQPTY